MNKGKKFLVLYLVDGTTPVHSNSKPKTANRKQNDRLNCSYYGI
ncbi:MAG: hypothetical protein V4590_02295 [Bacteroidota bacterium]